LASRETRGETRPEMVHACLKEGQLSETHACLADEARMAQTRGMQSSDSGHLSNSKQEEQQQQERCGSAAAGVVPSLVEEEEPEPPTRPAFLATLVADLADALTSPEPTGKRPAVGTSAKTPRRPVVRNSVPDESSCTKRDGQPSRPENQMKHKTQT
jgi:hypothetical protein